MLNSMKSINQQIHALIEKDIAIQKCLSNELINLRSLAQYLIKRHNLTTTIDAVISALRRYEGATPRSLANPELEQLFAKLSIVTKDDVAKIVIKEKAFNDICNDFLNKKQLKENMRL